MIVIDSDDASIFRPYETAIHFYERLGFALTGRTEPYPNDPSLKELEMALLIT